ncbi:hypothetical protein NGB36_14830 [Streptomyces sp. RB6PN25]|uniref:Uncharacterized protein n=1 Tax=Streptomyces humicola TaxID=2953240 RepID=A0ABT1PXM8_9ACTN|nr:hypothetical protein [Streptomyces humicola]MCQ4081848.1 hypothetical protein [Streptomyces humicola]
MTLSLPEPRYRDDDITSLLGDAHLFSGTVTTALAARQLGRKAVLVDIREDCHCMGLARLRQDARVSSPSPAAPKTQMCARRRRGR